MQNAVIFDWDGTLADTKFVVITALQKVLREMGCNVSDRFVERRIGIGTKGTLVEALEATNTPFTDEKIEELAEMKIEAQIQLTKTVNLFEGALDLLRSLQGRVKTALASMSYRKVIDRFLNEKRIWKYFNVVITADEVFRPKPNPEIFLRCSRILSCPPEKCVVIEDSIFGVKAAKGAGMKCIAISKGAYSKEELKSGNPDLIVDSLEEKEKILSFIFDAL